MSVGYAEYLYQGLNLLTFESFELFFARTGRKSCRFLVGNGSVEGCKSSSPKNEACEKTG